MKTYHFLSGLPRSGSTVLASILNQNPEVYVTPTSPMLNITVKMQEAWREDPTVIANYYEEQARNLTKAMLPAFWQHRPEPIIIDKGRGWAKNLPTASALFGKDIKILSVERDLPSIMASWLSLIRKQNTVSVVDKKLIGYGYAITDENRMGEMWFNMVKDCMEGIRQVRQEAKPGQLFIVKYDELISHAPKLLKDIEKFLELPEWNYDFDHIENDTIDDDLTAWGFEGLHTIRPKLEKVSKNPREILGDELYYRFVELEKEYV